MNTFLKTLEEKIDRYIKLVYKTSTTFPTNESYNLTSQLRRSALSVMLNFVEGYARFRNKVYINFLEISYGSLKESKYCVKLAYDLGYIKVKDEFEEIIKLSDEIGAMLYHTLSVNKK